MMVTDLSATGYWQTILQKKEFLPLNPWENRADFGFVNNELKCAIERITETGTEFEGVAKSKNNHLYFIFVREYQDNPFVMNFFRTYCIKNSLSGGIRAHSTITCTLLTPEDHHLIICSSIRGLITSSRQKGTLLVFTSTLLVWAEASVQYRPRTASTV